MAKMAASTPVTISTLFSDWRLLVILFVAFRLGMLLVYQPLLIEGSERGITAGGDFLTYYHLGALSEDGLLPFRDWWSEFPPIPSWLNVIAYQLAGRASYTGFAVLYGVLMLACDVGNLALLRKLGIRLHGAQTGMALAWIYALMLAPAVLQWWTFEPLVAFLLLLSLNWLLAEKNSLSAAAAGVGALVKFTPALILGAVFRFRVMGVALRYLGIVAAIFASVYVVLMLQNGQMTMPSLTAQFSKSSYQTVWALIDGNYRTGNFGPVSERLDPSAASQLVGNPSVIPAWLRLGIAILLGLFVYVRTRRFDDRGLVAFVAITLLIFFLQAQGWSPQWLAQLLPLLLLCFPTRDGIMALVILCLAVFAEYPFLWLRTGDTGGVITGSLLMPYAILVIARTVLLAGFGFGLYRKLRQIPATL